MPSTLSDLRIVENIADLGTDDRAGPFWHMCRDLLKAAAIVQKMESQRAVAYGYREYQEECGVELIAAVRLWRLFQLFRAEPFSPRAGDEIMARHPDWMPLNGSHRASVLRTMAMPVPAVLVHYPG